MRHELVFSAMFRELPRRYLIVTGPLRGPNWPLYLYQRWRPLRGTSARWF